LLERNKDLKQTIEKLRRQVSLVLRLESIALKAKIFIIEGFAITCIFILKKLHEKIESSCNQCILKESINYLCFLTLFMLLLNSKNNFI
jgi:hypothetical protein